MRTVALLVWQFNPVKPAKHEQVYDELVPLIQVPSLWQGMLRQLSTPVQLLNVFIINYIGLYKVFVVTKYNALWYLIIIMWIVC